MLSVVSHIHIARNLGSLINVIKISQQMFDHHESHHLLCITEVFRNSKNKKQKKKNPQNKIKKHNNSINSCSVKCFVHYFIKIKSLSKVTYLEEGRVGIPIHGWLQCRYISITSCASWGVCSLMVGHDSLDHALEWQKLYFLLHAPCRAVQHCCDPDPSRIGPHQHACHNTGRTTVLHCSP